MKWRLIVSKIKKLERYNNAQEEYYYFVDEYPNSKYADDLKKKYEEIHKYLENYNFEE